MRPTVVASVVASADTVRARTEPDLPARNPRHPHLLYAAAALCGPAREVTPMTELAQFSAVAPTPTGVIRAVRDRLDALERDLAAARTALAMAEAELIAAQDRRNPGTGRADHRPSRAHARGYRARP